MQAVALDAALDQGGDQFLDGIGETSLVARYVFNGVVWPDFSAITSPGSSKPVVHYRVMQAGKRIVFNEVGLTAIQVDHAIPAAGVIVSTLPARS